MTPADPAHAAAPARPDACPSLRDYLTRRHFRPAIVDAYARHPHLWQARHQAAHDAHTTEVHGIDPHVALAWIRTGRLIYLHPILGEAIAGWTPDTIAAYPATSDPEADRASRHAWNHTPIPRHLIPTLARASITPDEAHHHNLDDPATWAAIQTMAAILNPTVASDPVARSTAPEREQ